jgi:diguanylate cyclase (GGDEF)-like protein
MTDVSCTEPIQSMSEHWPTHPGIALRALRWAADESDPPFSALEEILLADPALTAQLLRVANSSLFGKPGRIATLAHAAALADRHLVRVASLQYLLRDQHPGVDRFDHDRFWKESWIRSRVAGHLASLFQQVTVDEARVAGLLADLGRLIQVESIGRFEERPDAVDWGVAWMRGCEFPSFLVEAIEAHREGESIEGLDGRARSLATVLHLTNQWMEAPDRWELESPLGLVDIGFLADEIADDLGRVDQVFASPCVSHEEIVERTRRTLVEVSIAQAHALQARAKQAEQHQKRAREYKRERDHLREQVTLDPLLGIANRKHFDHRLGEEFKRCLRNGQSLSLILFDIDRFKQLNDTYFHQAGDEVLRAVTRVMRNCLRTTDLLARYGGEEFAVVCPETDIIGGLSLAERMRLALDRLDIAYQGLILRVTASFGLATIEDPHEIASPADLIEVADFFLYEAKRNGRNCVRHGSCPHPLVPAVVHASREAAPGVPWPQT